MNETFGKIADAVVKRQSHFLVVSGNIYDKVRFGSWQFEDTSDFFVRLTEKKYTRCIHYNLFSGVSLARGNEDEVKRAMGLVESGRGSVTPAKKGKSKKLAVRSLEMNMIDALKKAQSPAGSAFPINPFELFPRLDTLLTKSSVPTAIILDHADALVPAELQGAGRQNEKVCAIALMGWAKSHVVRKNGHLIVLLCRKSADLDSGILDRTFESLQFRIPKPAERERGDFFAASGSLDKDSVAALAKATSGLALKELGRISPDPGSKVDREVLLSDVFSAKRKILQDEYGDLVEIMNVRNGFEAIGGLEKQIEKLRQVAGAMREGKTSVVPQGILFMGPPGTGKTVLAEAFAKEAGLNFVKPRDIKSMWVGESERRMTKFLDAIKDLSPVVVFIDEFDQSQAQRGGFDGDSGVSKGLFKKMLEVMSDTTLRGKVLWVLATNRPDLIDPAMKRAGRCDLRIPFLSPETSQLAMICKAAFYQYPDMRSVIKDWLPYAKRSANYTGADMIEVVRRAWENACLHGRGEINARDMDFACEDYRPQTLDRAQALKMSLLALIECSSNNLLPPDWHRLAERYLGEIAGQRIRLRPGADLAATVTKTLSLLDAA